MSRRGKHVTTAAQGDVTKPTESQAIVKALHPRGSNIFEVEYPDGKTTLVLLPTRFQKKLWVKNGGFLIIDKAAEAEVDGSKITGTIAAVLYAEHIKQLKKEEGVWPEQFEKAQILEGEEGSRGGGDNEGNKENNEDTEDEDDDGYPPLDEPINNRRVIHESDSEDSDEDE